MQDVLKGVEEERELVVAVGCTHGKHRPGGGGGWRLGQGERTVGQLFCYAQAHAHMRSHRHTRIHAFNYIYMHGIGLVDGECAGNPDLSTIVLSHLISQRSEIESAHLRRLLTPMSRIWLESKPLLIPSQTFLFLIVLEAYL